MKKGTAEDKGKKKAIKEGRVGGRGALGQKLSHKNYLINGPD